jgi:hypothetical protein
MSFIPSLDLVDSLSSLLDELSRAGMGRTTAHHAEMPDPDSEQEQEQEQGIACKPSADFATALSALLEALALAGIGHAVQPSPEAASPDIQTLTALLNSVALPLQAARASAWNFDPWEVAGLGRDEVRNSRVLAWLLNPRGSHGFGDALLQHLLNHLAQQRRGFPTATGPYCHVRTEQTPNGERSERVDLEIDAAAFYLLIEVKIGAPEGAEQLNRYGDVAQAIAGGRPWAILYLTPGKTGYKTGNRFQTHIHPLSWRKLAQMIEQSMPSAPVSPTTSWHATQHAVACFIQHIRNH